MSYFSRTPRTIATASSVPSHVTLPDDLDDRWEALKAYPIRQRAWVGQVSDATVQKWLKSANLAKANVSVVGIHKGRGVDISRRVVLA